MNVFKTIEESKIKVELVPIECRCGIQMKMDKRVIEYNEAFMCPKCRKIGFVQ